MFQQTTIAALMPVNRQRGMRRRFSGMRGLGDTLADHGKASAVQSALNNAYSASGTILTVDGVWGSRSAARMREYQSFIGIPANGKVDDYAALVSLGLLGGAPITADVNIGIDDPFHGPGYNAGGGAAQDTGVLQSIFDALTLKGIRDQLPAVTQAAVDQAHVTGTWTTDTAKAALKAGGEAAKAALKWLADNGDIFAKIAIALGVTYAVAMALMLGGGGLLLIMVLKPGGRR